MSRFPIRTPPKDPKTWKTHGFLTSPRWNLETAKATKPCKKRWFLNTTRRIHCKFQGTAPGPANRNRHEVSTRWSAAGAASVYNLRLPPKASGEDTGAGPAPGFKGCCPCRRPLGPGTWGLRWGYPSEVLLASKGCKTLQNLRNREPQGQDAKRHLRNALR